MTITAPVPLLERVALIQSEKIQCHQRPTFEPPRQEVFMSVYHLYFIIYPLHLYLVFSLYSIKLFSKSQTLSECRCRLALELWRAALLLDDITWVLALEEGLRNTCRLAVASLELPQALMNILNRWVTASGWVLASRARWGGPWFFKAVLAQTLLGWRHTHYLVGWRSSLAGHRSRPCRDLGSLWLIAQPSVISEWAPWGSLLMWVLSKRGLLVLLEDLAWAAWVLLEGGKALSV